MASSLLALLDDIATILDDVSLLAKVAAKKTAACWAMTWRSMRSRWPACMRTASCPWCGPSPGVLHQ